MLLTKEVEVRPNGKMIRYYKNMGYDAKHNQPLIVKIEDLPINSTMLVETTCDYCGKEKEPIKYVNYNKETKNGTTKCCCMDCVSLKRGDAIYEKYGYRSALQVPEIKARTAQTNLERYGSTYPCGNKEIREKQKNTNLKKYGVETPFQSREIQEKAKQTTFRKYGVENILLNSETQEKIKQTNLERYGVENVLLNKEIKEKRNKTMMEKFGTLYPLQISEYLEKQKRTNLERYGTECSLLNNEVKQKVKQTNLNRYGYENPMQSPEFLEKWFAENGSTFVKSSKQQQYLCNLYNGILNYPFKCFALDVYLPDDKIDVEFDGSGHRMSINLGSITEGDFGKKELYRNVAIKKEGYKQMRIISIKDLLPTDQILLQMLSIAREYFNTTSHSWINFDIDNSMIINAENKDGDGTFFDYGKLRKIKESA